MLFLRVEDDDAMMVLRCARTSRPARVRLAPCFSHHLVEHWKVTATCTVSTLTVVVGIQQLSHSIQPHLATVAEYSVPVSSTKGRAADIGMIE